MRRLDILLAGRSQALQAVQQELQAQGHLLHGLGERPLHDSPDLLIEDGSQVTDITPYLALDHCARLSLRVVCHDPSEQGLAHLVLHLWYSHGHEPRLILRQPVPADRSGNGQQLRSVAIGLLVEAGALLVSRFSRDSRHFLALQALPVEADIPEQGLQALDALAFRHRFNQTGQPALLALAQVPVIERLEHSLRQHAARPALTLHERTLSYAQLHQHSLAIQQALVRALEGLEPFTRPPVVGLCLPRCVALYAGLLAILGSGAVYLPLDPQQPLAQQRRMLDDSGAVLLLHDGEHPLAGQRPALDIQRLPDRPARQTLGLVRQRLASDAPCVVLYTSGSGGRPKGVLLSQGNLAHFSAWYAEHVQLSRDSRVLHFSTLGFDASLIDIIPTLIQGAELVVASADQRRDPLQLLDLIERRRLSHGFLPPALLSILPAGRALRLKHLVTGGDLCEPWVIEHLAPHCDFHNFYGPTEATVLVSSRRFRAGSEHRNLGTPIANSQVLILDEQQQPVAEDTVGELYISGPGVGLGYLNDPRRSAESFLLLELGNGLAQRVYRTGDLAKWTADGIQWCGRRDQQVKIRGFRVEPDTIEHCLRDSRLYRQVAVVIDAQRRILAFVAQPNQPAAHTALREHARSGLADYLQPHGYLECERLPVSAHGKIDRKALLALPFECNASHPRRQPDTPDEMRLRELWAALLEVPAETLCTEESFFNLGGHSILLSRLLLQIREHYGRGISINRFIEEPTLRRLALLVNGSEAGPVLGPQVLADAAREPDLTVLAHERAGDPDKILVTGANSFLGVHIVEALLAAGAVEVACLIRASSTQSAEERFAQALRDNRLEHLDLSRVRVYPGDMTQPRLGLAPEVHARIDREYGVLVHNAAQVNHVLDYASLAPANVEPLFECLRLCEGRSKKVLNFISSLSACSRRDSRGRVLEQGPGETPPIYIRNGYNLSKWVAERLLQQAAAQGAWVNLHRPGNIAFNSHSGVCQPLRNRLLLMLKGGLQLGQLPHLDLQFDLMPVDFLARFVAFHGRRPPSGLAVFNLHNPQPLSWLDYLGAFREAGHAFELVELEAWQRQLQRIERDNALYEVVGFYLKGFEEDIGDICAIDHRRAAAGVRQMHLHYPHKSPALLRKGCDYLRQIGFI